MHNYAQIKPLMTIVSVMFLMGCSDSVFRCDSDSVVHEVHEQSQRLFAEKLALEYRNGAQTWPVTDENGEVDPAINLDADDAIERFAGLQASKLQFLYGREAHKNYLDKELTCIGRLQTPVGVEIPISYLVRQTGNGEIQVNLR